MSSNIKLLADLIDTFSSQHTALVLPDSGVTLSYRQLKSQVNGVLKDLTTANVSGGDVVVGVLPNSLEFVITFLATAALGAVFIPVNPAQTYNELSFLMRDCSASLVILKPGDHPAKQAAQANDVPLSGVGINEHGQVHLDLAPITTHRRQQENEQHEHHPALMLYTSGTTNRPKGVPLTHENILAAIKNFSRAFNLSEDDTSMVVMPFFHVHGLLGGLLSTLYSGGTIILPPRFSASYFWQHIKSYGVTWYSAAPTVHHILLQQLDNKPAPQTMLRFIRSSSAKLSTSVYAKLEQLFGAVVLEGYGMTEAANQISANPLPPSPRKLGSVGIACGIEIAILDDKGSELPIGSTGEICIRGPSVMHGYHNLPEVNSKIFSGTWFRTGDLGYLDVDKYLYVSGRIKDLIIRGGENISPLEVEAVLLEHPSVAEAICFGVQDPKYGEEINAAVVLKDVATTDELITFCQKQLAAFKVPKKIYIATDLPRTATSKIQRHVIATQFS